jgi:hypothetical protein
LINPEVRLKYLAYQSACRITNAILNNHSDPWVDTNFWVDSELLGVWQEGDPADVAIQVVAGLLWLAGLAFQVGVRVPAAIFEQLAQRVIPELLDFLVVDCPFAPERVMALG